MEPPELVKPAGQRTARRSVAEGRIYLENGQPVLVRLTWAGHGPHNALIRRPDGTEVVRPFRGLRRPSYDHRQETT